MAQQKNTKVEGIVISKSMYRDRDLICNLLLRNGKKLSVLFFGGRGGGKSQKTSFLELGYLLKLELQINRNQKDLYVAKEWKLGWHHNKLRNNHKSFFLMCFFFEIISKIIIDDDSIFSKESVAFDEQGGLFRVASNALFYLEESIKEENFDLQQQKFLFLVKLIFELGVTPNLLECVYCGSILQDGDKLFAKRLVNESGGFSCATCEFQHSKDIDRSNLSEHYYQDHLGIFKMINFVKNLKYSDYSVLTNATSSMTSILFSYLCQQFQIEETSFKSLVMLK